MGVDSSVAILMPSLNDEVENKGICCSGTRPYSAGESSLPCFPYFAEVQVVLAY